MDIPVNGVAYFNKEVNQRLTKPPLKTNGGLANRSLTSLVKEATQCDQQGRAFQGGCRANAQSREYSLEARHIIWFPAPHQEPLLLTWFNFNPRMDK